MRDVLRPPRGPTTPVRESALGEWCRRQPADVNVRNPTWWGRSPAAAGRISRLTVSVREYKLWCSGQTQLGTRAFYRHFGSKDELLAALFVDMARRDGTHPHPHGGRRGIRCARWRPDRRPTPRWPSTTRLPRTCAACPSRHSPRCPTRRNSWRPRMARRSCTHWVEYLRRGMDLGLFTDIEPTTEAQSLHGVVGQRQPALGGWETGGLRRTRTMSPPAGPCSGSAPRGLGVAPETIDAVLEQQPLGRTWIWSGRSNRGRHRRQQGMGLAIAETLAAEGRLLR